MLPVAILAGGLATRLRPRTDRVPKSLLPVAGRPFIFHQLDLLRGQGAARVVLCVGHMADQIQAAVGNGAGFGLNVEYSFDGDTLKGTGGALKQALPLLGANFFVLNGDSYLPCSLTRIESAYAAARRPALMAVLRNEDRWDKSNVLLSGGELIEYDKRASRGGMSHIDFGISAVSSGVFSSYDSSRPVDLSDIWRDLSLKGQLAAIEVSERFYEIGSTQGIEDMSAYLSQRESAGNKGYARKHLAETAAILQMLDVQAIEGIAEMLAQIKARDGRIFFLGVGGSASNCSHAVNDFRKLAGIECYAPTDNVSELTARINDDGWESAFVEWLKVSRLGPRDAVFVLSVGGGNVQKKISVNLIEAVRHSKTVGAKVIGILGRDGGETARLADACVIIPTATPETVTPHCEAFQAVIWHLLVSHPRLQARTAKWESVQA